MFDDQTPGLPAQNTPEPLEGPQAKFPLPLEILFKPRRHKVLYGGRAAGRSWGCARALLLLGANRAVRVLCARELQNSIADSVHKLLGDQVVNLGLEHIYEIQASKIVSRPGAVPGGQTSFSFEGIKNNVTKIKSYEGIDYCWVEEANKVSATSWEVLLPTVRKEDSEIWMTFNPELETDYTYQRFVKNPSEDSYVIKMTWRDNPWVPAVMLREMEDLKKRDYDTYLNVWEGFTRQVLEGAVFAKELQKATIEDRICKVPWNRETPVDTFWDLGRRDMTCIWFGQKVALQYRILEYFEASSEDIQFYLRQLQAREYTYGTHWLPHDAKAKRLGQARTIEQAVRALYNSVRVVPRIPKKVNAINAARIVFPNCWFDEKACADGINRLRHYRYAVRDGQLSEEPLHDESSHGADAFMTLAQSLREIKPKNRIGNKLVKKVSEFAEEVPMLGWLAR
jgi:phage terminase large subunit